MSTATTRSSVAPLAAFAERFAAEESMTTAELLADLGGRFSFTCEAVTEDYLSPDVLVEDLYYLEHFLSAARRELQRKEAGR